jgi:endo-1,4-beta-xylanase
LKELAAAYNIWIGPCVAFAPLTTDLAYAETLRREFSVVTPENEMKWALIHPERERYDFTRADAIVDFARANGMAVHGHTLVWHNQVAPWLAAGYTAGEFRRDELLDLLRDHIATVVGRFAGAVAAWDVINEGLAGNGSLRETLWLRGIGPEYLILAFQMAHDADPQAKLLYNDFDIEPINPKSDALYALLSDLLRQGAPVHGVGFQMHLTAAGVDLERFARNMQRFADLGLDLYVTELDVRLQLPVTPAKLEAQAAIYRGVLDTCLAQPAFRGFQMWGFTDRHSWIPTHYPGYGAALPFDERYAPKPAYYALRDRLATR